MGQAAGILQDEIRPLIVDNGSHTIKSGLVGEDKPKSIFSSMIGRSLQSDPDATSSWIGADLQAQRDALEISYPIDKGVITNWDDMEKIWSHIFTQELSINPQDHPVLMTEHLFSDAAQRSKTCEYLFEKFSFPGVYLHTSPTLALFVTGKTSGCIIESGLATTQIVPIKGGQILRDAIVQVPLGGKELTYYHMHLLNQHLTENNQSVNWGGFQSTVYHNQAMKEKFSYAVVPANELSAATSSKFSPSPTASYTLPDNTQLIVTDTIRQQVPELLFRPELGGYAANLAWHQSIFNCIQNATQADAKLRKLLYNNIVLMGGNTLVPQLVDRIKYEVNLLIKDHFDPMKNLTHACEMDLNQSKKLQDTTPSVNKITASSDREFLAWRGGVLVSSMSSFLEQWLTKEEYQEEGASRLLERKCPLK